MRRERRQHGIVRTYRILPPPLNPRLVNSMSPPLTGRLFTKLPSKPAKAYREVWSGQVHWVRSNDIASSSYKLLTWRFMTRPGTGTDSSANRTVSQNGNVDDSEEKGGDAEVEKLKTEDKYSKKEDGGYDENDGSMSFYDVGMMMTMDHDDDDEDDGWCFV